MAINLRSRAVQVAILCPNLFDRRYRIGKYNYASDFKSRDY